MATKSGPVPSPRSNYPAVIPNCSETATWPASLSLRSLRYLHLKLLRRTVPPMEYIITSTGKKFAQGMAGSVRSAMRFSPPKVMSLLRNAEFGITVFLGNWIR